MARGRCRRRIGHRRLAAIAVRCGGHQIRHIAASRIGDELGDDEIARDADDISLAIAIEARPDPLGVAGIFRPGVLPLMLHTVRTYDCNRVLICTAL